MSNVFQNFMTFFVHEKGFLFNSICLWLFAGNNAVLFWSPMLPWLSRRCLTNNNNIKLHIYTHEHGTLDAMAQRERHRQFKYWWFEKQQLNIARTLTWLHLKSFWQMENATWATGCICTLRDRKGGQKKTERRYRIKGSEKWRRRKKDERMDSSEWALFSPKCKRWWYFAMSRDSVVQSCFIYTRNFRSWLSDMHNALASASGPWCKSCMRKWTNHLYLSAPKSMYSFYSCQINHCVQTDACSNPNFVGVATKKAAN